LATGASAADCVIAIRNRQQTRPVDLRRLHRIVRELFAQIPRVSRVELSVCMVGGAEMTCLNETYLHHGGSTDVITFDYSEPGTRNPELSRRLHGEIFICVEEAVRQARRYRTSWPRELIRYLVHGVLHLRGYDDRSARARRRMKREEDRLLAALAARFPLSRLARKPKLRV
jgi:probable rRNA maturation factor